MVLAKTKARLFVKADLAAKTILRLPKNQAHYLNGVMRARAGDAVAVFNGRDGEWLAHVESLERNGGSLAVDRQSRPQGDDSDLWLAFSPLKKSRLDFLVEKATELGASRLLPVLTRHTVVKRVNTERLGATAIEAAEQCERLSVPEVAEPVSLDRFLAEWPGERTLLVPDETGGGQPMAQILADLSDDEPARKSCGILIGPEGGFAASELDAVSKLPFAVKVGLGPRILRAETAALAALTCWQAFAGDWCDAPSFNSRPL